MDKEKIVAQIIETIADRLEVEEDLLQPETRFAEDLQADSLALMEVVLAFEETFQIRASDEDAEKLATIKDAIDFVIAKLEEDAG
jgi:acyl carrier protein